MHYYMHIICKNTIYNMPLPRSGDTLVLGTDLHRRLLKPAFCSGTLPGRGRFEARGNECIWKVFSTFFLIFPHVSSFFLMFQHFSSFFLMFPHFSSCFLMFHHFSSCFNIFPHFSSCFIIFPHVSSCFIIFHHCSSFFLMFHHFSSCFIMFHHFSSLFIIFPHVSSCFIIFHHFSSCFIIFHHFSSCFIKFKPVFRHFSRQNKPLLWFARCVPVVFRPLLVHFSRHLLKLWLFASKATKIAKGKSRRVEEKHGISQSSESSPQNGSQAKPSNRQVQPTDRAARRARHSAGCHWKSLARRR